MARINHSLPPESMKRRLLFTDRRRTGFGIRVKRGIAAAVLLILLIAAFAAAYAVYDNNVVVMGYYSEPGMMDGAEEGNVKSGYAYECMQEVAIHAGWKYTYVYGTFAELYDKLVRGEIDILPDVSATEERRTQMLFPDYPMINETLYLASPDEFTVSEDFHELNGKRIGSVEGYYHNQVFMALVDEYGIDCELVHYPDNEMKWSAVQNREVDAAIESALVVQPFDYYPVCRIGYDTPVYSGISRSRPDLLEQFNAAQREIDEETPSLLSALRVKYFKNSLLYKVLSEKDRNWLDAHNVLTIGVFNNDAPLIYRDKDGLVTGVMPDYVRRMFENFGLDLSFEWIFYDTTEEALTGLRNGEIDVVHPYYTSYNVAENEGVIISSTVYQSPMSLLYAGSFTASTMKRVATPVTRLGAHYVAENYPGSEIIACRNGYDCIDRLLAGEADSVILNSTALKKIALEYSENFNIKTLHTVCSCSFAALPENSAVIDIINRAVPFLTDSEVNEIEASYYVESDTSITVRQFFLQNPGYMAGCAAFLAAVVVGFVFVAIIRRRDRAKRQALEKALEETRNANAQVAEQQRQMQQSNRIISALSEDFGYVNYVQLTGDEDRDIGMNYRASEKLEELIPGWEKETNFKKKMLLLRDRLVLEDDRERFTEDTGRDNILEKLEKEDVYFTDFRLILGGEVRFYQMKFSAVRDHDQLVGVVAGLHSVDEEIRKEISLQKRIAEEEMLLNDVLEDEGVFLIDCENDRRKTFHDRLSGAANYGDSEPYSSGFSRYVDTFVCRPDYEKMHRFVNPADIPGILGDRKEMRIQYRETTTGTQRFYEMRIVRVSENEVLQSFRDIDAEMVNNLLFDRLRENYFALFGIDLDSGLIRSYKEDPLNIIGKEGNVSELRSAMMNLASRFEGETKAFFERNSDADGIRRRFAKEDKMDFIYKSIQGDEAKWVDVSGIVLSRNDDGAPSLFCIAFSYLDEESSRKQDLKEQLRAALDMAQSASRAKSAFLFNMSHDIRTPMNAILGYTNIALLHSDDGDKVKDSLQKIKQSGGHLLNLINDVLEMSRIEAGKLELRNEPHDIREAIAGIEAMSRSMALPKSIKFDVNMGEVPNPYVSMDGLHFNEVLINILSNAMKYSHEGGSVQFNIDQICEPESGIARYRFVIADRGIGMSEEYLEHIFETFSREKTATVSRMEGAGLGLSIVKNIVDMTGGTIDIQSRPGAGTTVTVELPIRVLDAEEIEAFRKEEGSTAGDGIQRSNVSFDGKRVLLVEDNEMNREIAQEILEDEGITVETAEDGDIAVRNVKKNGPGYYDFILMDIQMPVMNGYEATRMIRKMYPDAALPIVAVSANAFDEDRQASREAGMDEHVAKPINIKELFSTLAKFMK